MYRLFLVGGGSPPLTNGILASLVTTKINKPLKWWRINISEERQKKFARIWPYAIVSSVITSLFGVKIAIFGFPFAWFLTIDQMTVFLLAFGNFTMILIILTVITAFAYDFQHSSS